MKLLFSNKSPKSTGKIKSMIFNSPNKLKPLFFKILSHFMIKLLFLKATSVSVLLSSIMVRMRKSSMEISTLSKSIFKKIKMLVEFISDLMKISSFKTSKECVKKLSLLKLSPRKIFFNKPKAKKVDLKAVENR